MTDNDDRFLALQEAYANVYNQIVKPDKVFVATQYFRTRWVPLLGPPLAWLIIALRQHCYWNRSTGEKRDWCLVTQDELAREIGVSRATVKRLLRHEHAARFITEVTHRYRYDSQLRKRVRKKSLYRIRMDDPLVPDDEERLQDLLAQQLSGMNIDPETGQIDILQVLDRLSQTSMDDLGINMSPRSEEEEEPKAGTAITEAVAELAERVSGVLTGGDGSNRRPVGRVPSSVEGSRGQGTHPGPSAGQEQKGTPQAESLYPGAMPIPADALRDYQLGDDQVLLEDSEGWLVVPMVEVVKHDIRVGEDSPLVPYRTDCYYSIEHALGAGGDDWTQEEQDRIDRMIGLERGLEEHYRRLGAFSLEEALLRYFSPQFTTAILAGKSPTERERIEGWVTYTRQATGLKNPAGFLRTRIESDEQPPPST